MHKSKHNLVLRYRELCHLDDHLILPILYEVAQDSLCLARIPVKGELFYRYAFLLEFEVLKSQAAEGNRRSSEGRVDLGINQ